MHRLGELPFPCVPRDQEVDVIFTWDPNSIVAVGIGAMAIQALFFVFAASLRTDKEWVERARDAAIEMVAERLPESMADEVSLFLDPDEADFLLKG